MYSLFPLKYVLLIAVLSAALPEVDTSLDKELGGRFPVGKLAEECEEKEAAGDSSEDRNDNVAFAIVVDTNPSSCCRWAALTSALGHSCRVYEFGIDHCRAPPALLS